MVDYFEVAKYPLLDLKNFLIGFLISSLWFLFIPLFFVYGYMVETIRETLKESNTLPHWFSLENWKTYLKHGIFVFAIGAVYFAPPVLISAAATTIMGDPIVAMQQGVAPTFSGLGVSLLIIATVLFFASAFLIPMAIVLYSAGEDIKYAISLEEIIPRIKQALFPYLKAYGVSVLVYGIFSVLLFIPVLNFLVGGIFFYPLLFSARLFAEVFKEYE